MPSLKSIRRRIGSVKNTQKITKAMKLVAAARLRRAQQRILDLRPYAKKTTEILQAVVQNIRPELFDSFLEKAATSGDESLIAMAKAVQLLKPKTEVKTAVVLVLTSDRGLAGAYNSTMQRAADRVVRELQAQGIETVQVATIGRKGRDYFRRRGVPIMHDFTGAYEGGAKRAGEIARQLIDDFVSGRVDLVQIVYSEFKSAITQKTIIDQLLAVQPAKSENADETPTEYLFEPDPFAVLARLLPMYVEVSVLRAMLEAQASEHGARMTAMDNATRNAKKMISKLTLQYNRARQAAITKELMEIIGGAEALKG